MDALESKIQLRHFADKFCCFGSLCNRVIANSVTALCFLNLMYWNFVRNYSYGACMTAFDETQMYALLSEEQTKAWIDGLMLKLGLKSIYSQSDLDIIKDILGRRRTGFVHMMVENASVCLGNTAQGPNQAENVELFVQPCGLQRTSSSNIRAALEGTVKHLNPRNLQSVWLPHLVVLFFIWIIDQASSNTRFQRETIRDNDDKPNLLFLFFICFCHCLGISQDELHSREGAMGHVIAFAKLCKQVGTLQTLFIRCGDRIPKHVSLHPIGSIELLPEVKARSDAFIERVCSFTAYRTLTVAARRYKRNGDMHGFWIEARNVHKAVADVQACIVIRPGKRLFERIAFM